MTKFIEDPNRPNCIHCDYPMRRDHGKTPAGLQRYTCNKCKVSTTGSSESSMPPSFADEQFTLRADAIQEAVANGANRFVITSAANNCPVNYSAFRSLQQFCKDRKAHLIIIPIHYKNVSLYTANQEYSKWWAKAVQPYLVSKAIRIGAKTWVKGDLKVQATAANPLSGMNPIAGDKWIILGHSQMAMEPVATPSQDLPGRLYTTGAITQKSYSSTKAGAKASFHHVTGALYVETTPTKTFIRQLNFDSRGHVQDLTDKYTGEGPVLRNNNALSLTTGDEHVKWMLPTVKTATYTGKHSIVAIMKPEYIVRHDVLDAYAGSHHHRGNYPVQYAKWLTGNDNYTVELDQIVEHLRETTPKDSMNVIVQDSNHHDHLQTWLNGADDRVDHLNADLICELRMAQRAGIREGTTHNVFELYLKPRLQHTKTTFTYPNKPYMLGGVDHSQHGHKGANGARGSATGMANTTHKLTIGHTHSARIVKAVYQVGKSCGTLEYESGLSSHTNTHCLQYASGKRTLIDILGTSWRATNKPNTGGLPI